MNFLSSICVVLLLGYLNYVRTQEVCDLEDEGCITKGANDAYHIMAAGIKGVLEPIDPLFLEKISGAIESLKYEKTKVTLKGMNSCKYTHIKLNPKDTTVQIELHCPHLALDFNYDANGSLGSANVDSEGTATLVLDEYYIVFDGKYGLSISTKDQKLHFSIESYNVKSDLKGKLKFEHDALVRRNNDQSDQAAAFINENYKTLKQPLLQPTMEKFMEVFMSRVKTFIEVFPMDKIIPK